MSTLEWIMAISLAVFVLVKLGPTVVRTLWRWTLGPVLERRSARRR